MASTSTLRVWYSPACVPKWDFLEAYVALDACLQAHIYPPRAGVTGAQNCRKITGGTGYSLHAFFGKGVFTFWTGVRTAVALAVDINWDKNPYGPRLVTDMPREMIDDIYKIKTNSGVRVWRWGGYYSRNKDAMHFEIVCSPEDLATGIDQRTLPSKNKVEPVNEEDDMNWLVKGDKKAAVYVTDWQTKRHVTNREEANELTYSQVVKHEGGKEIVVPQSMIDAVPTLDDVVLRVMNDVPNNRTARVLHHLYDSGIKPAGDWEGLVTALKNMQEDG